MIRIDKEISFSLDTIKKIKDVTILNCPLCMRYSKMPMRMLIKKVEKTISIKKDQLFKILIVL